MVMISSNHGNSWSYPSEVNVFKSRRCDFGAPQIGSTVTDATRVPRERARKQLDLALNAILVRREEEKDVFDGELYSSSVSSLGCQWSHIDAST